MSAGVRTGVSRAHVSVIRDRVPEQWVVKDHQGPPAATRRTRREGEGRTLVHVAATTLACAKRPYRTPRSSTMAVPPSGSSHRRETPLAFSAVSDIGFRVILAAGETMSVCHERRCCDERRPGDYAGHRHRVTWCRLNEKDLKATTNILL